MKVVHPPLMPPIRVTTTDPGAESVYAWGQLHFNTGHQASPVVVGYDKLIF